MHNSQAVWEPSPFSTAFNWKTNILTKQLAATFLDAGDFHGDANQRKMAQGIPLTDDDRSPWLERVHEEAQKRQYPRTSKPGNRSKSLMLRMTNGRLSVTAVVTGRGRSGF